MNYNNATFEAAFGKPNQLLKSTIPEIVFSGRSNVGKSSLINKLLNRKSLARVSSKPGKTGTINFYSLGDARFVDLPGYGFAKVSQNEKQRWAELVEGYFNAGRNLTLVIQIVDMRHMPTKDDLNMINYLEMNNFNFIIVLTKSDKLNKTQRNERLLELEKHFGDKRINFLVFSSQTGEGVEELKELIEKSVNSKKLDN
ncbi:MAG: putative GTP-binding protein EngB [Eubacteriales bacterium SKADARSKE-1]|nr:putative GTP-binding protein EngB [Eubacteriales bacterium SKADARSKE-1]